jgi:hypothetical protein
MSNDDYQAGEYSGRLTGLSASIKALLKLIISEFSKDSATYNLMGVLRELKLESNLLDQLGRQHTLHEIWLETPVRIINYYPYEKKYVGGRSNEVLVFEHTQERRFERLRQKLENLYRVDYPHHTTDNKVVYVYELSNGRQVAVTFKDGRTVFGNTWNVQNY